MCAAMLHYAYAQIKRCSLVHLSHFRKTIQLNLNEVVLCYVVTSIHWKKVQNFSVVKLFFWPNAKRNLLLFTKNGSAVESNNYCASYFITPQLLDSMVQTFSVNISELSRKALCKITNWYSVNFKVSRNCLIKNKLHCEYYILIRHN